MPPRIPTIADDIINAGVPQQAIDPALEGLEDALRSHPKGGPPLGAYDKFKAATEREQAANQEYLEQSYESANMAQEITPEMQEELDGLDQLREDPLFLHRSLPAASIQETLEEQSQAAQGLEQLEGQRQDVLENEALKEEAEEREEKNDRSMIKIGKFDLGSIRTDILNPLEFLANRLTGQDSHTVGLDFGKGAEQSLGMVLDMTSKMADGLGQITQVLDGGALSELSRKIPTTPESKSAKDQTVRALGQYFLLFNPALKLTQSALGGVKAFQAIKEAVPVTASIIESGIPDAIATWFTMAGDDLTITELLEKHVPHWKELPFYESFMSYITSDPNDSEAMKRWKNVLEGQIAGVLIGYTLKWRQALKEFDLMARSVQKVVATRRTLNKTFDLAEAAIKAAKPGSKTRALVNNQMGAVGGNMQPENALPLVRSELRDAIKERATLEAKLDVMAQTTPEAAAMKQKLEAVQEKISVLEGSQQIHQERIVQREAEARVTATQSKAQGLQEKLTKNEAKVEEVKANMPAKPTKTDKNRLSRAKLNARRTKSELDVVQKQLAEDEGAVLSTRERLSKEVESLEAPSDAEELPVIPSVFKEAPPEGSVALDPLSRNNIPMDDETAVWLRDNQDVVNNMDVPIREKFAKREAAFRAKGAGSIENLEKAAEEYHIPLHTLDSYHPRGGGTPEEAAALVSLMRDELVPRVRQLADAYANNPTDTRIKGALLQALNDQNKAYAAYAGIGSEAGRTQFAVNHLNDQLDQIGAYRVNSLVQQHGGGLGDSDLLSLARRLAIVPEKHQSRFMNMVGKVLGKNSKWTDAIMEAYVALMFGFATVPRVLVGQNVMLTAETGARAIAGLANAAHLPGTAGSNITVKEAQLMAGGMIEGVSDSLRLYRDMKFGFDKNLERGLVSKVSHGGGNAPALSAEKLELEGTNLGGFVDMAGYLVRTIPRQIIAWDQVFQHIARNGQRKALAYRRAVQTVEELNLGLPAMSKAAKKQATEREYTRILSDMPEELEKQVTKYGEYTTFADNFNTQMTGPGSWEQFGDTVTKFIHAHPVLKTVMPFARTRIRQFQAATKYGLPGLGMLVRDTESFATPNAADRAALNWGKQGLGLAAGVLAGTAAWNGWLIGEEPKDPKSKELWRQQGWRAFSIPTEFDEKGRPVKSIELRGLAEPVGPIMRVMTDLSLILKGMWRKAQAGLLEDELADEIGEYMATFAMTIAKTAEDAMFFNNFTGLLDGVSRGHEKTIKRFAANMTPTVVKQTGKVVNPLMKEMETWGEHIKAQFPFLREDVATKYSFLGEPYAEGFGVLDEEATPGFVYRMWQQVTPAKISGDFSPKWRPVWNFAMENPDIEASFERPTRFNGVELSEDQASAYLRIRGGGDYETRDGRVLPAIRDDQGRTMREALLEVVESPEFQPVPDDLGETAQRRAMQRSVFKAIIDSYSETAKAHVMQLHWPELTEKAQALKVESALAGGR